MLTLCSYDMSDLHYANGVMASCKVIMEQTSISSYAQTCWAWGCRGCEVPCGGTLEHRGKLKPPVASFTKEVNPQLAKRPLKTNGRLANLELTSLVKEATEGLFWTELT